MDYNIIYAILIVVGVCGGFAFLKYAKAKNLPVEGIIKEGETLAEDGVTTIKALKSVMPENAKINTLSTIADIVLTATGATQQQYISSQLDADKRKEKAEKYIENGFKIVNFKETPEVKEWVDAVIDKTIYDNKTDAEKKGQEQNTLQKQVAQLQQEKSELQSQLNQKQQEVTSLTQKITTIQSTVKSEQPQQPADPTK